MRRLMRRLCVGGVMVSGLAAIALGQKALTWQELRDRFEATNPTLQAARLTINEAKAQEITAYLRPNPGMTMTLDQINPFKSIPGPNGTDVYRPFANVLPFVSASYLHERNHKRELRLESAQKGTSITVSQQ